MSGNEERYTPERRRRVNTCQNCGYMMQAKFSERLYCGKLMSPDDKDGWFSKRSRVYLLEVCDKWRKRL